MVDDHDTHFDLDLNPPLIHKLYDILVRLSEYKCETLFKYSPIPSPFHSFSHLVQFPLHTSSINSLQKREELSSL